MGKYNYFTNDFGNRDELKKNVFSYEVDKIVTDYLKKQRYLVKEDDDIFMIYIEEISREFSKNIHR